MNKNKIIDFSLIGNQVGCGYCANEKKCIIRDANINKAKLGCKYFVHFLNLTKKQ